MIKCVDALQFVISNGSPIKEVVYGAQWRHPQVSMSFISLGLMTLLSLKLKLISLYATFYTLQMRILQLLTADFDSFQMLILRHLNVVWTVK